MKDSDNSKLPQHKRLAQGLPVNGNTAPAKKPPSKNKK